MELNGVKIESGRSSEQEDRDSERETDGHVLQRSSLGQADDDQDVHVVVGWN